MSTITLKEIQNDPAAFVRRVESGESMLVVSGEQALAEVKPLAGQNTQPRPFGLAKGQFAVPADFDEPLPDDVIKQFECE